MERIDHSLRDPSWWFTAVVVGIVASIIAGFAKDYLERKFGLFLSWSRTKREERKVNRQRAIDAWGNDESLVIIAFLRMLYSLILAIGAALLMVIYVTYLRLKYNVPGITEIGVMGRLPLRSTLGLSILLLGACWFAGRTGLIIARLRDCLRRFYDLRGIPRI